MSDSAGQIVWSAVHWPFGKPFEVVKTKGLRLRFPGQWAIGGTGGLSYNWNRFYNPKTGRYTRPDPLGFIDGPSVYAYVGSNPMGFVDPDGQFNIVGAGFGAFVNFGTQVTVNYLANGGDFGSALKCVDIRDVLASGVLGGFGLGLGGNLAKGRFKAAAVGSGIGVYVKTFFPPTPVRLGSDCECQDGTGFGDALKKIAQ